MHDAEHGLRLRGDDDFLEHGAEVGFERGPLLGVADDDDGVIVADGGGFEAAAGAQQGGQRQAPEAVLPVAGHGVRCLRSEKMMPPGMAARMPIR